MEEILGFLNNHREVAFTTSLDNIPQLRVFQIMKIERGTLYFATAPHKQVYSQLQQNPNIEILALDNGVSVRVSGKVAFDVSDDIQREMYADNPVLPRLYASYTDLVYFRMAIDRADYYDLNASPPIIRSYECSVR